MDELRITPSELVFDINRKSSRSFKISSNFYYKDLEFIITSTLPKHLQITGRDSMPPRSTSIFTVHCTPTRFLTGGNHISITTERKVYQIPIKFSKNHGGSLESEEESEDEVDVLPPKPTLKQLQETVKKINSIGILECEICVEAYDSKQRTPRLLKECGHTVCEICARKLLDDNDRRKIVCPFDRIETVVDDIANQLPKNFAVLQLMYEKFSQTESSLNSVELDTELENDIQGPSTSGPSTFVHDQETDKIQLECPFHLQEFARFYCANLDCPAPSKIMCPSCMIEDGNHTGHSYISIEKFQEKNAQIKGILAKLRKKEARIKQEINIYTEESDFEVVVDDDMFEDNGFTSDSRLEYLREQTEWKKKLECVGKVKKELEQALGPRASVKKIDGALKLGNTWNRLV